MVGLEGFDRFQCAHQVVVGAHGFGQPGLQLEALDLEGRPKIYARAEHASDQGFLRFLKMQVEHSLLAGGGSAGEGAGQGGFAGAAGAADQDAGCAAKAAVQHGVQSGQSARDFRPQRVMGQFGMGQRKEDDAALADDVGILVGAKA